MENNIYNELLNKDKSDLLIGIEAASDVVLNSYDNINMGILASYSRNEYIKSLKESGKDLGSIASIVEGNNVELLKSIRELITIEDNTAIINMNFDLLEPVIFSEMYTLPLITSIEAIVNSSQIENIFIEVNLFTDYPFLTFGLHFPLINMLRNCNKNITIKLISYNCLTSILYLLVANEIILPKYLVIEIGENYERYPQDFKDVLFMYIDELVNKEILTEEEATSIKENNEVIYLDSEILINRLSKNYQVS